MLGTLYFFMSADSCCQLDSQLSATLVPRNNPAKPIEIALVLQVSKKNHAFRVTVAQRVPDEIQPQATYMRALRASRIGQ